MMRRPVSERIRATVSVGEDPIAHQPADAPGPGTVVVAADIGHAMGHDCSGLGIPHRDLDGQDQRADFVDQGGDIGGGPIVTGDGGLATVAAIDVSQCRDPIRSLRQIDQFVFRRGGEEVPHFVADPMDPVRQIGLDAFAAGVPNLHIEDGETLCRDSASGRDGGEHGHGQNQRRSVISASKALSACAAVLIVVMAAFGAGAQPQQDPDWPCIQRLVPSLSAGQIWRGPPIEDIGAQWHDDPEIASLVGTVTSRRVPIEDAVARTEAFAGGLEADGGERLTVLFAGIFQRIDETRSDAITAIKRYTRAQRSMVDAMSAEVAELQNLRQEPEKNAERIQDLTESVDINRRIFADRRQALRPLCEQPVLLEERLGALARTIMAELG